MIGGNTTQLTHFFLLGFDHLQSITTYLFILFLIIYILTLFGNALIVGLVSVSQRLKSPMFLFLRNLSLCEMIFTTNIVPKMLQVILEGGCKISLMGCALQLYAFGATGIAECLLLTSMSYDRYLAICKPLHYTKIMNFRCYLWLVVLSWAAAIILPTISISMILQLNFCGSSVVDHFFCDLAPVLELSCSDTSPVEFEVFAQTIPVFVFTFIYIMATYISIFIAILKIKSTMGRQKAFSTCSSHLTVVCTYYGTMISLYVTPRGRQSVKVNKTLSLLYSVVTPLLNPIIYSFRSAEIRKALASIIFRKKEEKSI
ncbi:olfactory receptor 10A7-like [Xenopus tropicalis]|uniref:Olfactory receptor n=1 Tax=Xenopus tropicalis TaxID=8364 RepID=A0A803J9Z9_XENTR|nr:olfactory receptor 10A7-like [Xenopus tropicalis]